MTSSRSSERGQIPQLFIFIMALLVIGATVFIGMKLLGGLEGTACSANDAAFQEEISDLIRERSTYGLRDAAAMRTPCDAVELCFVDAASIGNTSFASGNAVIRTSIANGVQTNIFIVSRERTLPAGYDARIAVEPGEELCVAAVGGRFSFETEGRGKLVIIRGIA